MTTDDNADYEALRRYLLGEEPEDPGIERRLLAERDLFELAGIVEEELLQECARGQLAPERCAELVKRLAATLGGRERLAFHGALAKVHAEPARPSRPAVLPFSGPRMERRRGQRWVAALAAGLAAAVVGFWLYLPPRDSTPQVWKLPVAVVRDAGGSIPRFEMAASRPIEIQVALGGPEESARVRASVAPVGGEAVWIQEVSLAPRDTGFTLTLPADKLDRGHYRLTVEFLGPGGESESLTRDFEVVVQ